MPVSKGVPQSSILHCLLPSDIYIYADDVQINYYVFTQLIVILLTTTTVLLHNTMQLVTRLLELQLVFIVQHKRSWKGRFLFLPCREVYFSNVVGSLPLTISLQLSESMYLCIKFVIIVASFCLLFLMLNDIRTIRYNI